MDWRCSLPIEEGQVDHVAVEQDGVATEVSLELRDQDMRVLKTIWLDPRSGRRLQDRLESPMLPAKHKHTLEESKKAIYTQELERLALIRRMWKNSENSNWPGQVAVAAISPITAEVSFDLNGNDEFSARAVEIECKRSILLQRLDPLLGRLSGGVGAGSRYEFILDGIIPAEVVRFGSGGVLFPNVAKA